VWKFSLDELDDDDDEDEDGEKKPKKKKTADTDKLFKKPNSESFQTINNPKLKKIEADLDQEFRNFSEKRYLLFIKLF
jgi:hypothetical protein